MAYDPVRAKAFAQAARICRERAAKISPSISEDEIESKVLAGKIEELELLAHVFDNYQVFNGSGGKDDFVH